MTDSTTEEKSGLQKAMESVVGSKGSTTSWPVMLVFLGLLVLVLSVVGIKMALTKRRSAELARKLREQEEALKQAQEEVKMADNEAARKDAEEAIKDAQSHIVDIQSEMASRKESHDEYVKELQSVTSWDQVVVVDERKP